MATRHRTSPARSPRRSWSHDRQDDPAIRRSLRRPGSARGRGGGPGAPAGWGRRARAAVARGPRAPWRAVPDLPVLALIDNGKLKADKLLCALGDALVARGA